MNKIDKMFYEFTMEIKKKTEEEVYSDVCSKFRSLPLSMQKSFEDYFSKFDYWGSLNIEKQDYEEIRRKSKALKENIEDFNWLYDRLSDYRSKKVLLAILKNWYQYDFVLLEQVIENMYHDYFDLDLVSCDKTDVLVDLGAYTGDTVLDYIDTYGACSKIYCYEITPTVFEILKTNVKAFDFVECRNKAASDFNGVLYMGTNQYSSSGNVAIEAGSEEVIAVTIDEDITESITIIKMDIEGGEQRALMGCQRHIRKDHPKLFISVYHNFEDLWKIPKMIEEICPGYQFYLRYHGGPIFPTEITLIAIYA